MLFSYSAKPATNPDELCEQLEVQCEQWVTLYMMEMEGKLDEYPCCVHCGGLRFRSIPGMRGCLSPPISETQKAALSKRNDGVGLAGLRVKNPRELADTKSGHAVELAVFAVACHRLRDKECDVQMDFDDDGNVHAFVLFPDGERKNPQVDALPDSVCECCLEGKGQ